MVLVVHFQHKKLLPIICHQDYTEVVKKHIKEGIQNERGIRNERGIWNERGIRNERGIQNDDELCELHPELKENYSIHTNKGYDAKNI